MEYEIIHDENAEKFSVVVEGEEALLDYKTQNEGVLQYHHTYVPKKLRGRGIASDLVRTALEYADKKGYKVIPSCSYVAAYLRKHPEFQHLKFE